MFRTPRINQAVTQRAIQVIIRTFPRTFVTIQHGVRTFDSLGSPVLEFVTLWEGEALIRPVSGTVQRLSMGEIHTDVESILIPGRHDEIVPGDFVHLNGKLYQIQRTPGYFSAFKILDVSLYQQQP